MTQRSEEPVSLLGRRDDPLQSVLLSVQDLRVSFRKSGGQLLPVIDSANLMLEPHGSLGIVGESGSGKTMLCRSLIGTLSRRGAIITSGHILFEKIELANAPEKVWRQVRGREIGYIPQSSLAGLNPILTIGTQLVEAISTVESVDNAEAEKRAVELLDLVRIPRAKLILHERAHQLSGGMRQRVMIAAALAQKPKLLIADEPTTSLDVTIQHEILELISQLRRELGMALILVTHDLAVVEEVCTSVMVMYAGSTVELGSLDDLATAPRHPYTLALRLSRVDRAMRGRDLAVIPGDPATVGSWTPGCRFAPRCLLADDICRHNPPPALERVDRQFSACFHADQVKELYG